jgi:quercetin dioxygenase-like cupin family protein
MGSRIFDWSSFKAEPNKTGAVRHVVQQPTATLDELEIHITTLNPGETPHPPHQHPAEELVIVKEGTVESLVNGEMQRVGPGSIIFQASNQMHSIRNVGSTPATYHVIQWKSPGMGK